MMAEDKDIMDNISRETSTKIKKKKTGQKNRGHTGYSGTKGNIIDTG